MKPGTVREWKWDDGACREIQIDTPKGEQITIMISKQDPLMIMLDNEDDGGIEFTAPTQAIADRLLAHLVEAFKAGATSYATVQDYVTLNRMLELTP